ncbi:MAG: hypothetical protein ACYTXL_13310, partial [Nostoc sp.]
MKYIQYLVSVLGAGLVLSLASTKPVQAQVAYGSYIGIGPAIGITDGIQLGGVIAGRYKLLEAPISLRAQVLIGNNTAVV